MRLVAVLGYSRRADEELHAICEARVRHAESIVREDDVVLLSGEAELMHGHWRAGEVLLDPHARNTRENALGVAKAARELGADQVVVVTSRWHAPRAAVLVRAALRHAVPVETSSPVDGPPPHLAAREAVCLAVLPLHLVEMRRRAAATPDVSGRTAAGEEVDE
ncbi:MAG TPA: YdcF family protein [Gaiellaceae bacterium]|nr:YdcF family protein [Gaiellaceae bacterium]